MKRHLACFMLLLAGLIDAAHAQAPVSILEGTWQGTLAEGATRLRLVLEIFKASDGLYLGTLNSVDQGATIPIDRIEVSGAAVRLELKSVNGTFEGSLDGARLQGTWSQRGSGLPLEFARDAQPGVTSEPAKPAASANPLGVPVDLDVPVSPVAFSAASRTHLAYELHITNFRTGELLVSRLEVMNGNATLASFEGAELHAMMQPVGPGAEDHRAIGGGRRAIVFLWITLDPGAPVPSVLRHRITAAGQTVEGGIVRIGPARPVVIGPPLRGSDWIAINGPDNASVHRRAVIPAGGRAQISQRFAIDWVRRGADDRTFTGDPSDNQSYHAYGQEVLAVADGVVSATKDGIPQNVPGATSRAVPITIETIGGNHIILNLGAGRFAFYAHLQPGSLRVKVGDQVRRGQVLGLVGNSGNSSEPHLHFHVSDGNSPLASEGLPYLLDSFEVLSPGKPSQPRRQELPLANTLVGFLAAP